MNINEWTQQKEEIAQLTDSCVTVKLVNGAKVSGYLTGVGYAGLRIMPSGKDYEVSYGARLIESVTPRGGVVAA